MLKLTSSYSKKVPVEGQDFSSQQYHASVELELSDSIKGEELTKRIHDTFQLVRKSVETELGGKPAVETAPALANNKSTRTTEKASNKQIKFMTDLAVRNGYTLSELNAMVAERYKASGIYDLTRQQASAMLDSLVKRAKAA